MEDYGAKEQAKGSSSNPKKRGRTSKLTESQKREKKKECCRTYRKNKADKMKSLEEENKELKEENKELKEMIARADILVEEVSNESKQVNMLKIGNKPLGLEMRKMEQNILNRDDQDHVINSESNNIPSIDELLNDLDPDLLDFTDYIDLQWRKNTAEEETATPEGTVVTAAIGGVDEAAPNVAATNKREAVAVVPTTMTAGVSFSSMGPVMQEISKHVGATEIENKRELAGSVTESHIVYTDTEAAELLSLIDDQRSRLKTSKADFKDLDPTTCLVKEYQISLTVWEGAKMLFAKYPDFDAGVRVSPDLVRDALSLLCCVLREMDTTVLEDLTRDLILRWRGPIRDAQYLGFKVDFALVQLRKAACAYLGRCAESSPVVAEVDSLGWKITEAESKVKRWQEKLVILQGQREIREKCTNAFHELAGKKVGPGLFF